MSSISLLALLGLIVGLVAERKGFASSAPAVNRIASKLLVQLFYPALVFSSLLLRFHWQDVISLLLMPLFFFVVLFAGWAYGRFTLGRSGLTAIPTRRSYVFLSIMPNYSYVPLVIAQLIWGERGIALVAIASVAADISLWTYAFPQIAGRWDWRKLFSPALLTLALAFIILYAAPDVTQSTWVNLLAFVSFVGKFTLPLSMYVLGTQLARAGRIAAERKAHRLLLLWRLLLCPLIMTVMILGIGQSLPYEAKAILLLVASMPGAVITVVLAQIYEADGRFAATQILLGHLLALLSVGFWQLTLFYFYLNYF